MEVFIPGQRWVSTTESELGLGLILEVTSNRISVVFPACGEKRLYARDNTPLTRVKFTPGEIIEANDSSRLLVQRLIEHAGIITYLGRDESGREKQLQEQDLNDHIQFNRPQDRLYTGQVDPGSWFNLRYQTWQHLQRLQQSPVRGLIGGRTSLIPHQLYIAHEAAGRYAPRIMLADEVGLGKTIEAGLILQHRLINGLSERVLIIVPESLVHQWLVEMLRRFNLRFSIFDEERCHESHSDNPFITEQLILCSQDFFSSTPHRQQQALQTDWDMVIVDEAHHLQWDEVDPSPEYRFIEQLGQQTPGLVLLTATPEQMGKESHFARLRLLDPDRFHSYEVFLEEEKHFEPVAAAASMLMQEKPLDKTLQASLNSLLKHDHVEGLLDKLIHSAEPGGAREELINILLDHHGTGRILFRNSRHTVKGFPQRQCLHYSLTASGDALASAVRQTDGAQRDPRYHWLVKKIQEFAGQKALLICKQAQTALDLSQTLKNQAGLSAPVFNEGMTILERDRAAAWFADEESTAPLLICSEIGSEGRNFQFVHHLILYDLPEIPDLLQQRIGRLDRIGQKFVIQIHVPTIKGTKQEILFKWYDQGMNAFRSNCSAAQRVYQLQKQQLAGLLMNADPASVGPFIDETARLCREIEEQLHHGRDQLLEFNSCRSEIARDLIRRLTDFSRGDTLWSYMEQLTDSFGVNTEFHSSDCYILSAGNHLRIAHFPELPEDGVTVTTNRDIALAREDMQFLTWEHPMVTAAMDLVVSSDTGNAAVSIVKHEQLAAGQFLLETLFIVECSAPATLQVGRFLPATPIRVLINQNFNDLSDMIEHDSFVDTTEAIETEQIAEFLVGQKIQIDQMLDSAKGTAQQTMASLINHSSQQMLEALTDDIKRLVRLKKMNPNIKQVEIDQLKDKTRESHNHIQSARLKLDAVRFIIISE